MGRSLRVHFKGSIFPFFIWLLMDFNSLIKIYTILTNNQVHPKSQKSHFRQRYSHLKRLRSWEAKNEEPWDDVPLRDSALFPFWLYWIYHLHVIPDNKSYDYPHTPQKWHGKRSIESTATDFLFRTLHQDKGSTDPPNTTLKQSFRLYFAKCLVPVPVVRSEGFSIFNFITTY